jgi:hypothetical protein
MKALFCILSAWAVGLWCAYLPFRSLHSGSIKYRLWTYERSSNPFWFWFYVVASGVCGAGLVGAAAYFTFTRL